MTRIRPEIDLGPLLAAVENPGRYLGGEYGCQVKADSGYRIALCFPDLYEIGMSNQAMEVLYGLLNALPGVACERVFAPDLDFEEGLRERSVPLYTLETGTPLAACDMVAFSVGYELAATSILAVLDRGEIPLETAGRGEGDPIVIAGGPALTNPLPFGRFLDAVYLGEAEASFLVMVGYLRDLKARGGSREDALAYLRERGEIWFHGRTTKAVRAVWRDFGRQALPTAGFPVPSIRVVQDHGSVEIMRGCPNGCRFCHAGILYRPFRTKGLEAILEEVDGLVRKRGYREITLSSLSTGDFSGLQGLVEELHGRHAERYVSFSLPSLRINSFALELLELLSTVRKSGLTFAVETPGLRNQRGLNKPADTERIEAILQEASARGWKQAKFYFMLGLPLADPEDEAAAITEYLLSIKKRIRMNLSVNLGTFVPKPHTPFQWASQLGEVEAQASINRIREALPPRSFKVGYHAPFQSLLEGVICRGDERVGELILNAYALGARLDAWEDRAKKEVWRRVFSEASWDVPGFAAAPRPREVPLPWKGISLGVSPAFLNRELDRSQLGEVTEACVACSGACAHPCGACTDNDPGPAKAPPLRVPAAGRPPSPVDLVAVEPVQGRFVLFSFTKEGKAAYIPHLGLMQVFERAFLRAGVKVAFTQGFNPKPRLEFAQPLPVGVSSADEVAKILCLDWPGREPFIEAMNRALPEGLRVTKAQTLPPGVKPPSLMSVYGGARYLVSVPPQLAQTGLEQLSDQTVVVDSQEEPDGGRSILLDVFSATGSPRGIMKILKAAYSGQDGLPFLRVNKLLSYSNESPAVPLTAASCFLPSTAP